MKVAIQCDSPLLQRALELFCKEDVVSYNECDVVIRDKEIPSENKETLFIGNFLNADLGKPFSKEELYRSLEIKFGPICREEEPKNDYISSNRNEGNKLWILEEQIRVLTREYQNNIIKAIRMYHES